jgi:hypothetical protein
MNIQKLKTDYKKLDKLDFKTLNIVKQSINYEIENYLLATKNYTEDKIERFSKPYIQSWENLLKEVQLRLDLNLS